nr:hypothetical protein [uncultured Vibrio sp.]
MIEQCVTQSEMVDIVEAFSLMSAMDSGIGGFIGAAIATTIFYFCRN